RNPFVIPGIRNMQNIESQLNPNYTFEHYIEGECNQLARSAGIAVANKPGGTSFNPLVLYGGVGLGKTHLAQAIGNHVKSTFKDKTVLYVSSEKFTNQFIDAVKNGSINDFMNFYQIIDVLIVDDIQFFANKDRTQDIFFHTFNHLHQSGKQIILTSDRPPKDLEGMEERLISRFKWGLTADLQVPDLETRIAILEKKLYMDGIEVPRSVTEYMAYHINTNVRELEGALISLLAQSSLSRKEIDISLAKSIVRSFVNNLSKEISVEYIQKIVSDYFKVPIEQLTGKTRKRQVVQARQISMYLAKSFTDNSLKAIGKYFGGRDHSTVIHACRAVLNLMETDRMFQEDVTELQKQINMSR
ncbi:MAG: chromosomal replication initiator protein DnaA, partial [Chitinophagales bacterium]